MIENATNLTNATNITNLTSNAYTIASWVLQWWRWLVGIGTPSVVIMYYYRVLAKALCDIEIIECNNGYTCKYKTTSWLNNRLVLWIYLWLHRAWGLWKQIEPSKNRYDEKYKEARKDLAQILVRDVWKKVSFDIEPWDGRGDMPSNWYLAEHWVGEDTEYDLRDAIIQCEGDKKRYPPLDVNKSSGKFILLVFRTYIAGADTESKRAELMNLIRSVWDADKTKELVRAVKDAKNEAEKAEEVFKEKLARIVNHVRFWNDIFSLRPIKEKKRDDDETTKRMPPN